MTAWEAWAAGFLAHMYAEDGRFEQAVSFYQKAISALERTRLLPSWLNQLRIAMARAGVLGGIKSENVPSLFEYYGKIKVQAAKGWASLHLAEILMYSGRRYLEEAHRWARQAAELDSSGGTLFHLAWDYALLGRILHRQGDRDSALEFIHRSLRLFKDCGAQGGVRKVLPFEARLKG